MPKHLGTTSVISVYQEPRGSATVHRKFTVLASLDDR